MHNEGHGLRFGVVGVSQHHGLPNGAMAAAKAGLAPVALAEPDPATREHAVAALVAAGFTAPREYDSGSEMLRTERLDAVGLHVPTKLHASQAIEALVEHRVHVMVEKPLAATHQEATAVLHAARSVERRVMVGLQKPYCVQAALRAVHDGVIGTVIGGWAEWVRPRSGMPGQSFYSASMGHGVTADLGVHLVDLISRFVGVPPVRVATAASNRLGQAWLGPAFLADDTSQSLITYAGGFSITVRMNWATWAQDEQCRILLEGTEGSILIKVPTAQTDTEALKSRVVTASGIEYLRKPLTNDEAHVAKWRDFAALCRGEAPGQSDDEILNTQALISAMQTSAESGGVQVELTA